MSDTFGDFDEDDAFDREPPDADQVTYKVHDLRVAIDALVGRQDLPRWDDLTAPEQDMARGIGGVIVRYIVDHEPEDPEQLARTLHNARRFVATSPLPPWEDMPPDDRRIGIDLMELIMRWLERQGGLDAA